jgi:SAM-dependent methyltransferase
MNLRVAGLKTAAAPAREQAAVRPLRRLYVSFWGRRWQTDPAARARAAEVLEQLTGMALQASYYVDEGWYDGMRPSALHPDFVRRTVQLLITRGVVGEVAAEDDPRDAPLLVMLDDSLKLGGALDSPRGPYHAHLRTMLGGQCAFGVAPWSEAPVTQVLNAIAANPVPAGPWAACHAASKQTIASSAPLARLPAVVVAERAPRFRISANEVQRYVADLGWPPTQATALALRRAADAIEKAVVRHATRPTPATESELSSFHGPNPRITFAERLECLRRYLHRPEHPDARAVEEIVAGIDETPFAQMRVDYFNSGAFGFVDTVFWTYYKLLLARTLGLDKMAPLSVLDIGCGGGHFGRVCQTLGHQVIGTDIDNPVYFDIAKALGVDRRLERLEAMTPMPDFGRKFDLVMACQIEFDRNSSGYWSLDNWKFLFDDLVARQLRFPGRIYITLNYEIRQGRGVFNEELMAYCAGLGASVNDKRGIIDWALAAPVKLD